jgi:hypothetical protein
MLVACQRLAEATETQNHRNWQGFHEAQDLAVKVEA